MARYKTFFSNACTRNYGLNIFDIVFFNQPSPRPSQYNNKCTKKLDLLGLDRR